MAARIISRVPIPSTITTIVNLAAATTVSQISSAVPTESSGSSVEPYRAVETGKVIGVILGVMLPPVILSFIVLFGRWNRHRMRKGKPHYFPGAPKCCLKVFWYPPPGYDMEGQPTSNNRPNNENSGEGPPPDGPGRNAGLQRFYHTQRAESDPELPAYRSKDPLPVPPYTSGEIPQLDGAGSSRQSSNAGTLQGSLSDDEEVPGREFNSFDEQRARNPEWDSLRPQRTRHRELRPDADAAYLATRMELYMINMARFPNPTRASERIK